MSTENKINDKKTRRDKILNAAEILFSEHGFDGVTMRQIAKLAGVDVALPNYYFNSKKGLFEATFHRRAVILNTERTEALKKVLAKTEAKDAKLEDIIGAFLRPIQKAQDSQDQGWRAYCSLVAMINNSSIWGQEFMSGSFDELADRFIQALKKSLPHANEKDIYWSYHFMSGALALTMADTGRIDRLSNGLCHSGNLPEAYDKMIPFIAEGMRRICLDGENK